MPTWEELERRFREMDEVNLGRLEVEGNGAIDSWELVGIDRRSVEKFEILAEIAGNKILDEQFGTENPVMVKAKTQWYKAIRRYGVFCNERTPSTGPRDGWYSFRIERPAEASALLCLKLLSGVKSEIAALEKEKSDVSGIIGTRKVFVIHGRDASLRRDIFTRLLQKVDLQATC